MKLLGILLICLFIFSSCDEAPQLSSISKIATTFDTGNTTYPGGLMVVGVREDGPEKISFSFASGISTPIQLEKGDWTFYGIGYAGPSPFSGDRSCGMTSISFRKGTETNVNLNMNSDGCSGKLSRTLKLKHITFSACSASYNYNFNTNTFGSIDESNPSTFCNVTGDLNPGISHYKITSLNQLNNTTTDGFSTCNFINTPLNLPTRIFPFKISLHRSFAECQNNSPHVTHTMLEGLEYGDSQGNDFLFKDVSVVDTRIVLAANHTGKFRSAFMNMLPRITCGTNDCTSLPVFDRYINVPWSRKLEDQLILKNVNVTSCSDAAFTSNFFSVKDCRIKNRHAYVSFQRNNFTCQPASGITSGSIVDIYTRNGRTFVLSHEAGRSNVEAFTSDGISINSFQVAANTSFIDLAATDSGDIYVMSLSEIKRYQINSGGAYNVAQIYPFGGFQIEVEGAGNYMFVAIGTDTISSVRTSDGVPVNDVFYNSTISQLQMNDSSGDLFSLEIRDTPGPPVRSTGFIRKTRFDPATGTLTKYGVLNVAGGFSGEGMLSNGYFMRNFHVSNGLLYTLSDGGLITTLQENPSDESWFVSVGPSGPVPGDAQKFIVNSGIALVTNGTALEVLKFSGTWTQIGSYSGSCQENATFTIGANSETLVVKSVHASTNAEKNPQLIEAGLKFNGRRNIMLAEPLYYFKHLSSEQTRNTFGGYLSTVQRILGPGGVGGMLSDFTCENLDAAVNLSPLIRTFPVNDPYYGYRSYNIKVRNSTTTIPQLICDDNLFNGFCTESYDIQISLSSTGLLETESYVLKLKCSSKKGELLYHSENGSDLDKQLTYWNTNSDLASRYEHYQSKKTSNRFEADIAVVKKSSSNNLWSRAVTFRKTASEISANAIEYQRDSSRHFGSRIGAKDIPDEYPTNPDYLSNRSNVDLSGPAVLCLDNISGIPVNSAPVAGCSITNEITSTSRGLPLSFDVFDDAETPGSDFWNLFTTSP